MQNLHGRIGHENGLIHLSVDVFCPEKRRVYELCGCYFHGHTCLPFRDVRTVGGNTLAERYEQKMTRLEQITRASYRVIVQWECEID